MNDIKRAIISVGQFTAILLIGGIIVVTTSWMASWYKKPDVIETIVEKPVIKEVVLKPPSCEGGYEEFQDLVGAGQSLQLLNNTAMHAKDGKLLNSKDVLVSRSGTGEVACGYLYVRARKDGKSLEEKYDSVYINPQDFGGHLLGNKGPFTIKEPEPKKTEFLLPLSAVSYIPKVPFDPNAQNYRVADWVDLLNVSSQVKFSIGLSTLHVEGAIENITIAYRCWDPASGKESQGCQLGL